MGASRTHSKPDSPSVTTTAKPSGLSKVVLSASIGVSIGCLLVILITVIICVILHKQRRVTASYHPHEEESRSHHLATVNESVAISV